MAVKLGKLLNMTAREISGLSRSELRETYQNVRKIVKSRANTFAKHGIDDALPAGLAGLGSSRNMSDAQIAQALRSSTAWMRGSRSTYKGYAAAEEDRRKKIQEQLPDLDLSTSGKLADFGKFMNEMKDRYKSMGRAYDSSAMADLYREAKRLNVDPYTFGRNYDYWRDHISELERTDPINTRSDRKLYPSDYARKLGLEKIKGGRRK